MASGKKMGRPSAFKPEFIEQARVLCEQGATDVELADFFQVSIGTITNWKHDHRDFLASLKVGKAALDDRVERSLASRALGYTFDSEKIFCSKDGVVTRVPYREHVPPDVTACIFWLKNRRQQQWRDVHKHEHGRPGEFDNLNADDLRAFVAREAAALGVSDVPLAPTNGTGKPH